MTLEGSHGTPHPLSSDERIVWKWLQYFWPKWKDRFSFEIIYKFVLRMLRLDISTNKTLGDFEHERERAKYFGVGKET